MRKKQAVVNHLISQVPKLMAVYAFGSRVQGTSGEASDLDLAVLVEGYVDPVRLFDLANALVDLVGCAVDLVDFRAAPTVLQYQILTQGQRWWESDFRAAVYEAAILSQKTDLDTARAELLEEISRRGHVYGR